MVVSFHKNPMSPGNIISALYVEEHSSHVVTLFEGRPDDCIESNKMISGASVSPESTLGICKNVPAF